MTDLYKYCTRCGEELEEEMAERYAEDDSSLAPLCRACFTEVIRRPIQTISDAMEDFSAAMGDIATSFVEGWNETVREGKSRVAETSEEDPRGGDDD